MFFSDCNQVHESTPELEDMYETKAVVLQSESGLVDKNLFDAQG